MSNAVIYKLEAPNGKVYIGQSWRFLDRMNAHHQNSKHKNLTSNKLYNSIRKYGWGNFTKEILISLGDVEQAVVDKYEQFWIEVYAAVTEGLNSNHGGVVGGRPSDATRALWSILRVGNKNSVGRVLSVATRDKIRQKAIGRVPSPATIAKMVANSSSTPVVQVGLDGSVIKTWPSIAEARRQLGISSIHKAAQPGSAYKSAGGFQWFYANELPEHPAPVARGRYMEPIAQLRLDGSVVKTWESITAAARGVQVSAQGLIQVLKGRQQSAGGFRWIYLRELAHGQLYTGDWSSNPLDD